MGQLWKGTWEQGPPPLLGRPSALSSRCCFVNVENKFALLGRAEKNRTSERFIYTLLDLLQLDYPFSGRLNRPKNGAV